MASEVLKVSHTAGVSNSESVLLNGVNGHTYTIFGGFKGGKGVGTLGGMMIALFPTVFPFCLGIAIIIIMLTGYVSLASIIAS